MQNWLINGSIYPENMLRRFGWSDEHLRAPYACRVREGVVVTDRHGGYVIPKMKCDECGKSSPSEYRPLSTKYDDSETI